MSVQDPKSGKLRLNKPTWDLFLEGKSIVSDQKSSAKRRAPDLENQKSG
jgi:hypothetical protein